MIPGHIFCSLHVLIPNSWKFFTHCRINITVIQKVGSPSPIAHCMVLHIAARTKRRIKVRQRQQQGWSILCQSFKSACLQLNVITVWESFGKKKYRKKSFLNRFNTRNGEIDSKSCCWKRCSLTFFFFSFSKGFSWDNSKASGVWSLDIYSSKFGGRMRFSLHPSKILVSRERENWRLSDARKGDPSVNFFHSR